MVGIARFAAAGEVDGLSGATPGRLGAWRFDRCGLDLQLAKAGAVNGDEIRILGFAFTYEGEGADDDYSEVNEAEEELFADSDDVEGQE